jgi:hypothetical protein
MFHFIASFEKFVIAIFLFATWQNEILMRDINIDQLTIFLISFVLVQPKMEFTSFNYGGSDF